MVFLRVFAERERSVLPSLDGRLGSSPNDRVDLGRSPLPSPLLYGRLAHHHYSMFVYRLWVHMLFCRRMILTFSADLYCLRLCCMARSFAVDFLPGLSLRHHRTVLRRSLGPRTLLNRGFSLLDEHHMLVYHHFSSTTFRKERFPEFEEELSCLLRTCLFFIGEGAFGEIESKGVVISTTYIKSIAFFNQV